MPDRCTASLCGISLSLVTPESAFLRDDSLWRLRAIYQPFLTLHSLPQNGVAVDIGAGFGAFALPFARRYPGWQIWCFEPDAAAFAALQENIRTHELTNVRALPLAVGDGAALAEDSLWHGDPEGLSAALAALILTVDDSDPEKLCPVQAFRQHAEKRGFLQAGGEADAQFTESMLPTLPPSALAALRPDLAKITAPQAETGILQALRPAAPRWVLGESWSHLSPRLLGDGTEGAWMPFAGAAQLALRRGPDRAEGRAGLDIVMACDNPDEALAGKVWDLLAGATGEIRVVLVSGHSGDDGAIPELLRTHEAVTLLHRPPGRGRAAALNFGRLHATARHIAFIEAKDRADAGLFPELLELALLSGAEVVQGGLGDTSPDLTAAGLAGFPREPFANREALFLPADKLLGRMPPLRSRLYRRDFLDGRGIWFPGHVLAFAEHFMHLVTLRHGGMMPVLEHVTLQQAQDDGNEPLAEDALHLLEVYRLAFRRAVQEGWNDFAPLLEALAGAISRIHPLVQEELQADFTHAAAELWVGIEKTLGRTDPTPFAAVRDAPLGLAGAVDAQRDRLAGLEQSHAFAWLDSPRLHARMMRMQRKGVWD